MNYVDGGKSPLNIQAACKIEDSISHMLTLTQLAEESNALTVLPIRTACKMFLKKGQHATG